MFVGPNGAGKSTLYKTDIASRFPEAEFVNADLLAQDYYGHSAGTPEESRVGQRLAEQRRNELMIQRHSLATESTFSHPSKLDLLDKAKAMGYNIHLYHINLKSADLSLERIAFRVAKGGHPVPENKARERYLRNQPLIRKAVKIADRAYVFDNSQFGEPPRRILEFAHGHLVFIGRPTPGWVCDLYASELV